MRHLREWGIVPKLTLVFVLFAALVLTGGSLLSYFSGRAALQAATTSDLLSIATEKEGAFNTWVIERQSNLTALAALPVLADELEMLLTPSDSEQAQLAHDRLLAHLAPWTGAELGFLTLMIIEPEAGRVILATSPDEEGKFKEDRLYFLNGLKGPYVQNPYYSLSLQGPAMTAATPIFSEDGHLLGVLAGRLNLGELNTIIGRRTGLRQTGEAYLVNSSNLFVTQPHLTTDPAVLQRGVRTEAVKRCLSGREGIVLANDYRGVPVIAAHRWLAARELCLIIKIDQAEAFAPVQSFGQTVAFIGILTLLGASLLGAVLARTITRPVLALQASAARLGQGELNIRLPESAGDELGLLGREFNTMAARLQETIDSLEQRVQQRTQALTKANTDLKTENAERRQAEQAARHLAAIVEASNDAILGKNLDGQITSWNKGAERLYGYSAEEVMGQSIELLVPKDRRTEVWKFMEKIKRDEGIAGFETVRITKDGRSIDVALTISPIKDETGQLQGASTIARDITERKQAEQELAAALQRERAARTEAEEAQKQLAFLAEASRVLASSLDYQTTLTSVAQLVVPIVADWCAIDIVESKGSLERVVVVHSDPAKVQLALELQQFYPPNLNDRQGVAQVLRTGQSEFYSEIPNSLLEASIPDEGLLKILKDLGLKSVMIVPMSARDETLGAITLIATESDYYFDSTDLALAEELGRRAALAVDNARLYRQAQKLNTELEQRVNERTSQLAAANAELAAEINVRKQTEEKFRRLLEAAPDGIIIVNEQGQIMLVNAQIESMFGYKRQNLIEQPVESLIPNRYRKIHPQHRADYYQASRVRPMGAGLELYGLRQDSSEFPVEISLSPLETEEGLLVMAVIRDTTKRKQAEEALRSSEARYRTLLENSPDIISRFDKNLRHLYINPVIEREFGLPSDYYIGKTNLEIDQPAEVAQSWMKALKEVFEQGKQVTHHTEYDTPEGTKYYQSILAPEFGPNGSVETVLAITRNVTEQKLAEQQLNAYQQELQAHVKALGRSNQELEQFASVASHDLQEPLRMVSSYVQLLARRYQDKLDEDAQEFIHYAVDGAHRMQQLINDLLTFSRVGTRGQAFKPTDCEVVLQHTLTNLQTAITETNTTITHDPLPTIMGDEMQMLQLFQNLIGNAIKFHGEHPPKIHIGAKQNSHKWTFSVQDNGIGLEPQYAERIFVIFQRLHGRNEYPGTGIGLAVCKKIVERHGGQIWVDSEPGKGTTFYFTIPNSSDETPLT